MCKKQQDNSSNDMNPMMMMMMMQLMQRMGDMQTALTRVVEKLDANGQYNPAMQQYLGNLLQGMPNGLYGDPSLGYLPPPNAGQIPGQYPAQYPGQYPGVTNVPGIPGVAQQTPYYQQPGIGFGLNQTWRLYPV